MAKLEKLPEHIDAPRAYALPAMSAALQLGQATCENYGRLLAANLNLLAAAVGDATRLGREIGSDPLRLCLPKQIELIESMVDRAAAHVRDVSDLVQASSKQQLDLLRAGAVMGR